MDILKEKEYFIIKQEINMMVNGKMVKKKVREYFITMMKYLKVIDMMVNGKMI